MTDVFTKHGFPVLRHIADRVALFSKGKLVEANTTEIVFLSPEQPYAASLLAAVSVVTSQELSLGKTSEMGAN